MLKKLILLSLMIPVVSMVFAQEKPLKIGVVNMQAIINESNEGRKTKRLLEAELNQSREELAKKKQEIESIYNELQTSLLLSDEAKVQKQQRADQLIKEFQRDQVKLDESLKTKERRKTAEIITTVSKIVKQYGDQNGFDMIIEAQVAEAILFSKFTFEDVTGEMIKRYNDSQKTN